MGTLAEKGRIGGAVVFATICAVLISGCSAAPQPLPTRTEGSSGSPERPVPSASVPAVPVPTSGAEAPTEEELERVNGFVARPDVLELRDDDGAVVTTLSYMSSPSDAIAVLSVVFGEPPTDEEYRGTNHTPPGVFHSWGDFVLDERLYDEQRRIDDELDYLVWPRFAVYFNGPASGDLPMSSIQGIQAGDSWEFASSRSGFDSDLYTCIGTAVEVVDVPVPDGGTAQATVVVLESDDATVRWVGAPEMVVDGCA